ncbi:MAG: hypothetical protein HOE90_05800 [Bacteriovoracaceae bacterium]|nr:hypothetical protein [Bacteriovoracaceae bacterium]
MKFVELTSEKEINTYREMTSVQVDVLFPIEYLKRSRVVVWMDHEGVIKGGFVIVTKPPFRVLESIPQRVRNHLDVEPFECVEVTGLWLHHSLENKRDSARFWLKLYREVWSMKKENIIYAYDIKKKKLKNIYQKGKPEVLYKGITIRLQGMKTSEVESVEMVRRKNVLLTPLFTPSFLISRLFGKRRMSHLDIVPSNFQERK